MSGFDLPSRVQKNFPLPGELDVGVFLESTEKYLLAEYVNIMKLTDTMQKYKYAFLNIIILRRRH